MRLCAICSFPVGEHPDDGLVHPWDCLNLDDLFVEQVDVTIDRHGNRVTKPRRTHSKGCPDGGLGGEASFTPDAMPTDLPDLLDRKGKIRLRGYQVKALEPLRDGREEVRPFGSNCKACGEPVLAVIVDQSDSLDAVRPMVGPTGQVLAAACPCGAAASIVPLWGGLVGYGDALDLVRADLDEVLVPAENWPPPMPEPDFVEYGVVEGETPPT